MRKSYEWRHLSTESRWINTVLIISEKVMQEGRTPRHLYAREMPFPDGYKLEIWDGELTLHISPDGASGEIYVTEDEL